MLKLVISLFFIPATLMAQITLSPNGNVAIGANPNQQYKLNIECSTSTDCGNTGNRRGISALASHAYGSYGIYGRAENAFGGIGVHGHAQNSDINWGIRGSAEGSNSYGGYFTQGIYVSGGITQPSDEHLKTNVRSLYGEGVLSKIQQLTALRFEYLSVDKLHQSGLPTSHAEEGDHFGLSAQELEGIFPELVKEVVHLLDEEMGLEVESGIGLQTASLKSINYTGLIVVLIAAVQELHERVEELERNLD